MSVDNKTKFRRFIWRGLSLIEVMLCIAAESGAHEILHGKPATIQVNAYVPIKHFA